LIRKIILIGSSTGGPGHLQKILSAIPRDFSSPLVIGQHINSVFLDSIVESANSYCKIPVFAAKDGLQISNSSVYFARGPSVNEIVFERGVLRLKLLDIDSEDYSPSINRLFGSAASFANSIEILAILMTGIGDDGARALLGLRRAGAVTVAESESSAVVYGMPRAARELGAALEILDLDGIIRKILEFGR